MGWCMQHTGLVGGWVVLGWRDAWDRVRNSMEQQLLPSSYTLHLFTSRQTGSNHRDTFDAFIMPYCCMSPLRLAPASLGIPQPTFTATGGLESSNSHSNPPRGSLDAVHTKCAIIVQSWNRLPVWLFSSRRSSSFLLLGGHGGEPATASQRYVSPLEPKPNKTNNKGAQT